MLRTYNILSAPGLLHLVLCYMTMTSGCFVAVLKADDTVLGVFEVQELLSFLVETMDREQHTRDMYKLTVEEVLKLATRRCYSPLNPNDSCLTALELFGVGIYRAPIVDLNHKLVGLLTQVDLVMHATMAMRTSSSACHAMGQHTLKFYGVGVSLPMLVLKSQSVGNTISQLDHCQVSALPVIDDDGMLVGNFSVSSLV
jgi:CBS-domain-containing membrane protein